MQKQAGLPPLEQWMLRWWGASQCKSSLCTLQLAHSTVGGGGGGGESHWYSDGDSANRNISWGQLTLVTDHPTGFVRQWEPSSTSLFSVHTFSGLWHQLQNCCIIYLDTRTDEWRILAVETHTYWDLNLTTDTCLEVTDLGFPVITLHDSWHLQSFSFSLQWQWPSGYTK